MTADLGANIVSELERMIAAERTIERCGFYVHVSELCPVGMVCVVHPTVLDLPDDPSRRVLVVPTEAVADQVSAAAQQAGLEVIA